MKFGYHSLLPCFTFSLKCENLLRDKPEHPHGGARAAQCYQERRQKDDIAEGQIIIFGPVVAVFAYGGWMRAAGAEGCQAGAE